MRENLRWVARMVFCIVLCATAACGSSGTAHIPDTTIRAMATDKSPESSVVSAGTASNLALRQVDGGPAFHSEFRDGLPSNPNFFPLALWSESVVDDTGWPVDKAAGINTYVEPVVGTELDRIAANGMYALSSWATATDPVAGYFTADEVDMWAGPGDADATGNVPGQGEICSPTGSACGYTVMAEKTSAMPPDKMAYTNYGKGVAFWESDAEAARFVNDYQDVVSVDTYWFTDPNICGHSEGGRMLGIDGTVPDPECRLAANYGRTVDRVRSLVEPPGSKPVWGFIELAHPFSENDAPTISAAQIRAAVWSSIIHEARGIVYFNHNFGGDCQTQHVLRDCDDTIREAVTAVNGEVTQLAPMLNAPFVDGVLSETPGVDTAAKMYDGKLFVLAGSTDPNHQTMRLEIRCEEGTLAEVVGENRAIPIVEGALVDEFADGNSVHIYEISDGNTCDST